MWKYIYNFGDKLEDRVRGKLSRKPIIYAFVGGVGIVLFWRGVWHLVDTIMYRFFSLIPLDGMDVIYELPWWDGLLSLVLGTTLLLLSGIFVSNFIGNEIIISGIRGEKKTIDKTEQEITMEIDGLALIEQDLKKLSKQISSFRKKNKV